MTTYDAGDLIRLTVTWTNLGGTATDPTTVTLRLENPYNTVTSYTYAGGEITRSGTGVYYRDVTPSIGGLWYYRWEATGAVTAAEQGTIYVQPARPAS